SLAKKWILASFGGPGLTISGGGGWRPAVPRPPPTPPPHTFYRPTPPAAAHLPQLTGFKGPPRTQRPRYVRCSMAGHDAEHRSLTRATPDATDPSTVGDSHAADCRW